MVDIDRAECQVIEAAVAKRLRPFCADMSVQDFDDLVRSAALIQFKYERQQDVEARILFGIFADNTRIVAGL
jgi:hypothetical protein